MNAKKSQETPPPGILLCQYEHSNNCFYAASIAYIDLLFKILFLFGKMNRKILNLFRLSYNTYKNKIWVLP